MKTYKGKIQKETFINDEWYFLDVPFEGSIFVDEKKFTDVDKYVGKVVECEVIEWDHTQKRTSDKYKVVGIIKNK
tara:strand:+ start:1133 stop:1357 length:225 start_codon:yes stop_codon:yes gene_type:complete